MELAASTISGTASFDSTDNAITDSIGVALGAIDAGTGNITLDEAADLWIVGMTLEQMWNGSCATELAASTI